jgi:hypothetical protein
VDCAFAGDGLQNVVWYTFFAPTNGTLIIETTTEPGVVDLFDPQIQILDACGGEVIACDEDGGEVLQSRIELGCDEFEQGAQYYLQVDGYNGQTGTFKIETSSGPCPTPANDLCVDATPLAVNLPGECPGNAVEGTTLGSNNEGEVSGCEDINPDVFYSFNSGSFSNFNLGVASIDADDLVIGIYEECTGASLTCSTNPVDPISLDLTPNTDYLVRVSTNLGFGSPGSFNICLQGVYDCSIFEGNIGDPCDDGDPNTVNDLIVEGCSCIGELVPVNNDPCNAITVNCGSTVFGSTTTATESGLGAPSCASGSLTDVFYNIFAIPGNTYEVTVNGDDYDGVLVAYTGACDGDLTQIACADDGIGMGIAETISFSVGTAQSVLIRTYDWSSSDGSYELSVSCTLPNIACADATPITFGGDPVYGNNNGAGPSGPNMDCAFAGDGLQNVVWYTFFAPTNGTLIIETTFEEGVTDLVDTQIQLLDACGGEVIACSEDVLLSLLSRIELACDEFEQGAQYYLQVDGFNGQTGTFKIETSSGPCPTPENDVCADATPLAVNLPGECPGNAVEGTTLGSNNEGEVGGAVCEPINPDVFYSFNSGSFSNFNLGVSGITATDLVIGVYEECTGASIFCAVNPAGPVSLELTPETDYIVRVSTNLTFGIPGTFNICLQGVYDCPDLSANIGDSCDDGNPATDNDVVLPDCTCLGEFDCPELGLNIGDACDDGDPTTINDTVTPDCDCVGSATPANDLCENAQTSTIG